MTLSMDVRIVADDARIGFVFVRRGIVPRGMLELVPASRGRDQPGDGVGCDRPRVRRP
jgi:enoyl-CoA hydratase/carnithine racemase